MDSAIRAKYSDPLKLQVLDSFLTLGLTIAAVAVYRSVWVIIENVQKETGLFFAIVRWVAVLVPDERWLVLFWEKNVRQKSKQAAFHLGLVLPQSGEGSPCVVINFDPTC